MSKGEMEKRGTGDREKTKGSKQYGIGSEKYGEASGENTSVENRWGIYIIKKTDN